MDVKKPRKKEWGEMSFWEKMLGLVLLTAIVIAIIWFIGAVISGVKEQNQKQTATPSESQTPKAETKPKAEAKYTAKIVDSRVVNPATWQFDAQVKNTGTAEGKPKCTVRAHDESNTYKGFDFFEKETPLQPEKIWYWSGNLTITKEGATFVTETSINCTN